MTTSGLSTQQCVERFYRQLGSAPLSRPPVDVLIRPDALRQRYPSIAHSFTNSRAISVNTSCPMAFPS